MLVVGVLLLVIAGITLPMMTRVPHRIEVENALGDIRRAFSETSTRARALGTALSLTLYEEEARFVVSPLERKLPPAAQRWSPPIPVAEERSETISAVISTASEYSLPSGIQWDTDERDGGEEEYASYHFFEDGQAAGGPLRFTIGGRRFQMDVDSLTGEALIEERED